MLAAFDLMVGADALFERAVKVESLPGAKDYKDDDVADWWKELDRVDIETLRTSLSPSVHS